MEVLMALNVVESVDAGVTKSLTFPLEISLSKDAKESPLLTIAYSVLKVEEPLWTIINSVVC